jgi:hypothetical protein
MLLAHHPLAGSETPVYAVDTSVWDRCDAENSWQNAHKKLVWCTEWKGQVIDFWISFSNVIIMIIIVGPGSSEKPGAITAGKTDPPAVHDLLAQALNTTFLADRVVNNAA